jgi:hypothetical protein
MEIDLELPGVPETVDVLKQSIGVSELTQLYIGYVDTVQVEVIGFGMLKLCCVFLKVVTGHFCNYRVIPGSVLWPLGLKGRSRRISIQWQMCLLKHLHL